MGAEKTTYLGRGGKERGKGERRWWVKRKRERRGGEVLLHPYFEADKWVRNRLTFSLIRYADVVLLSGAVTFRCSQARALLIYLTYNMTQNSVT